MDENFVGQEEVSSLFDILIVVMFICIGVICVQQHVRYMNERVDLNDNYDKVYASREYEEVVDKVYKFTPYQAYMMCYYMDIWAAEEIDVIDYTVCGGNQLISMSPGGFEYSLVKRNNMISGANNTSPSVHEIIEANKSPSGIDNAEYYRGSTTFYLSLTDDHEAPKDLPGNTHVDDGGKEFRWVMDKTNHIE